MAAWHLDRFNLQQLSCRAPRIRLRDHPIVGASDVGGRNRRPFAQRRHLLRNPPLLATQPLCRRNGDLRVAIVIEDFDGSTLGPRGAAVRIGDRRLRWSETCVKVGMLGIEAQARDRDQSAQVNRHPCPDPPRDYRNRESSKRVADEDYPVRCVGRSGQDCTGVAFGARGRVLVRQVESACRVASALKLPAEQVPAPGAVVRAVDQNEVHRRHRRAAGSRHL